VIAALTVWGTASAWPDLAVAGVMAAIFLTSSVQILRQAWMEYRGNTGRQQTFVPHF
jgi:Co/Zn/Cd efflux system component